jgi:D-alanyl-D-alanine endopeptidase (penicillin-binding protein 7)
MIHPSKNRVTALLGLVAALALAHPLTAEAKHRKVHKTHAVATRTSKTASVRPAAYVPPTPTFAEQQGLHGGEGDPVGLKSAVALVLDQDTNEVLVAKNPDAVLPIASITKLMTAMVVTEAHQDMDEELTVTDDDVDKIKHSSSRLAVGTKLTRGEMLHLALMASENRAAHALGRSYPGGLPAFVAAMNAKAKELGMGDTRYVEPTGLSSDNQSSAHDLALLVKAAHEQPLLRELSTSKEYQVAIGRRQVAFHSTNALVRGGHWDIGLQKTGFINEAGRCMVMQAQLAGRHLIMVLLDSAGKYTRFADAERIRKWVETHGSKTVAEAPKVTS